MKVTDFTKGSPAKHIMAFYWPLIMTSMLQQVYNFVDMMIVGKGLGDHALASVGNMSSLFFLIVGFSFGLANGFGVLIAHSFGAKNMYELRHRLACTIQLTVIIAIILTTFSVAFLPYALRLIRTDELLMDNCLKYGYIIFGGLTASICYNVSAATLRALGDSRTPLKAIIISSMVNLSLDSFLIFVVHTGVEGAAIATIVSQIISTIICVRRLCQIPMIRLRKADFVNDRSVFVDLIRNGLPMAFMNSITAIGVMVVQYFINGHGVNYTTAYSACSKYLNLFMNPASTAGNAMSAFTSQNYGAKQYDRIKQGLKVCLTISFAAYILLGSLMAIMPEMLVRILINGDEPVRLACQYLPICGVSIIAVDCLFVIRSGVQGMGDPVLPMWSGVLEMVLRIAAISILMDHIGFRAAAIAEVCAWTGALIMNIYAFCRILIPKLKEKNNSTHVLQKKIALR
ncbi:MAG: MATE family efflux transporter [Eubacterium sp.]|nr:MATE family efflux transporter [Eubacterium sp.]